ncbi:ATP-binding cassette domain-containing protein [Paeniglutamicibacter sp. NPDC012692]|uniref:ATP-binding cassette domain-containing protein n=1 Tax=Paeniglutamicibacter sp. NPDC012692 TaxID=3364388 RepID=UPI00369B2468
MNVSFENVSVTLGGRRIVNDVSLTVPSGTVLGLLGPNGCGKSTLLRTLYRARKPSSGVARVDGADVRSLDGRELARRIAVMAQESTQEFPITVREMAMLGRVPHQRGFGSDSPADHDLIDAALREVGAAHLAVRYFAGLSGGEKQRVLLARTLVQQTPVLVLDEPTNHLDISFQLELMSLATSRGLTVLTALHDMNLATEFCDSVAVLRAGELQAVGHPDEVLDEDAIRAGFGVDSRRIEHPLTGRPLIAVARLAREQVHAAPAIAAPVAAAPQRHSDHEPKPKQGTRMNNRNLLLASGLLLGGTLLAGCGQAVSATAPTESAGAAKTIENCGRTLTFNAVPQRAVAMTPGQSEMLVRLGQADKVVAEAQSKGRALTPELADLGTATQLSEQGPPSREVLLGVTPDLVYSPTGYEFTAEQGFAGIDQLKAAGAQAYIATAGCPERRSSAEVTDLLTDIENMGAVFGVDGQASTLAGEARGTLDGVTQRVSGLAKPTVAELFVEGNTIAAIGAGIEYNMIEVAGGENVFSPDDKAFAQFFSSVISPETLVAKNPEVIVFTTIDKAHEQATRDFLRTRFPQLDAVKNNRLVAIDSDDVMPGTWGNLRAVEQIAAGLHPDAF